MKIAIDTRLALRKRRGMGRVLLNVVNHLAMVDRENQYILYLEKEDTERILPATNNFMKRVLHPRIYPLWEQVSLPIACKIDNIDVLHCQTNTGPVVVPGSVKLVVTLHDVMFLKSYSEIPMSSSIYQNFGRLYRRLCVKLLSKRIDCFVTVSECSRQDIQRLLSVPLDKIVVISNGIDNYFLQENEEDYKTILSQLGIDSKFIFHLGGISPNKNTIGAIKAYSLLVQEKKYRNLLLVVGGVHPESNNQIIKYVKQKRLEERVRFLHYMTDEELKCLYSKAELFLFPSLYEGFGLPTLESMACGTPVVASNSTSIPEAVGEAGILVNPTNIDDIRVAMKDVLDNEGLRRILVDKGRKRAHNFKWKEAAKKLLQVYEKVLER